MCERSKGTEMEKAEEKVEQYEASCCEAEMELALISDRLGEMPPVVDDVSWAHIGAMRYIVHMLREVRFQLDKMSEEK